MQLKIILYDLFILFAELLLVALRQNGKIIINVISNILSRIEMSLFGFDLKKERFNKCQKKKTVSKEN